MARMALADLEAEHVVQEPQQLYVSINVERCVGCQECIVRCPTGALTLDVEQWKAVADEDLCVGCRQCERTCPFGVIEVTGPALVSDRLQIEVPPMRPLAGNIAEIHRGLTWEEAQHEAARCLECPDPTCILGCPAHNDIPAFIAAIREGDLGKAGDVLRATSVMPDICSRVCDQSSQCEGACSWQLAGAEPVKIGLLERFVTEQHELSEVQKAESATGLDVAVVGSGPAGVAAAWKLLEGGARVTMFEKDTEPGGVLRWGIPDFTLPKSVAERPLQALLKAGLNLRTDCGVDDGGLAALRGTFDAVVLAHGASQPMSLRVPGAQGRGIEDATRFLTRAKTALREGNTLPDLAPGAQVLVVGAGNTAMDVARSARRLGLHATAVDWMDRRFAAVREDELAQAESEGIKVLFNRQVDSFDLDGEGHVVSAGLMRTEQRKATERPHPVSLTWKEAYALAGKRRGASGAINVEPWPVDHVVVATGYRVGAPLASGEDRKLPERVPALERQFPDRRLLASGLPQGDAKLGKLVRQREWLLDQAAQPVADRIWAVGDALSGPSTVVGSMAQGLATARAILSMPLRPRKSAAVDQPRWNEDAMEHARTPEVSVHPDRSASAKAAVHHNTARKEPVLGIMGLAVLLFGLTLSATIVGLAWGIMLAATGVLLLLLEALHSWVDGWVSRQEEDRTKANVPHGPRRP